MSTPTPRTDAAVKLTTAAGHNTVCPNFARTLERELTTLTAERDQLRSENAELRASSDEHAKGYVETRKRIAALESEIDRLHARNAVLESATARAERAEAAETVALTNWNGALERAMKAEAALAELHDSFAGNVHTRCNELRDELAAEREKVRVLRAALENLCDEQNGAPLETRRDQWQLAMDEARLALASTEGKP